MVKEWEERVKSRRCGQEEGIVLFKVTLQLGLLKVSVWGKKKSPFIMSGVVYPLPVLSRIPVNITHSHGDAQSLL